MLKDVRVKGYMFEQRHVARSKVVKDGVEQIVDTELRKVK